MLPKFLNLGWILLLRVAEKKMRQALSASRKNNSIVEVGSNYPTTLVFGRPIGLRPSSQSPRSRRALIRSKRFITDFLPPAEPDAFKLLCLDIIDVWQLNVLDTKLLKGKRARFYL